MFCPKCHDRLAPTRTDDGLFYECPLCRGRAMTMAVARRVVERDAVRDLWRRTDSEQCDVGEACPSCCNAMREIAVSAGSRPLHLDVCRSCQMLWFDPHELESMPQAPRARSHWTPEQKERVARAELELQKRRERGSDFGSEAPAEAWKWLPALLGMPIEHEVHPVRSWPWITWGVAAVCVVVALLTFGNIQAVANEYGMIPSQPLRHGGITFVTSFFLHVGLLHLVGNVYFLVIFGDNVEDFLGRWKYAVLLIVATFVGDVTHMMADPRSDVPSIGASGGISGVIVYYALQFPRARLGFLFRFYYRFSWIYFPAYVALIFWALLQLFQLFMQLAGASSISALAHLGGAAVGLGAWLLWRKSSKLE